MEDSTFRKVHAFLDRLRRKTENTTRRGAVPSSDHTSDSASTAADDPKASGISIRDILREENRHLADELMGLIREASDARSKAPALNPITSIAVQTDAPAPLRLVSRVGGVKIAPTQLPSEARLTVVPRVSTIEIAPTEAKTGLRRLTFAPRVCAIEIVPTHTRLEEKQPALVPRVGGVKIIPPRQVSESSSSSGSAPDRRGGRSITGVPETFALDWKVNDTGRGPGKTPTRGAVIGRDPSEPRDLFKMRIKVQWVGQKWISIKLPDVPSAEYEATRPWLFPGLHASQRLLRDATNRLTLLPDAPDHSRVPSRQGDEGGENVVRDGLDEFEARPRSAPGDTAILEPLGRQAPPFPDLCLGGVDTTTSPSKHGELGEQTLIPQTSFGPPFDGTVSFGNLFGKTTGQETPESSGSIFGGAVGSGERTHEGPMLGELPTRVPNADHDNPGISQARTPSRPSPSAIFGRAACEDVVFDFDFEAPGGSSWP